MTSQQRLQIVGIKVGVQVAQPGQQILEWRLASEALGAVAMPVFIYYESSPPLTEGEVVASVVYPKKGGGTAELQASGPARAGLIRIEFTPEAYGEVWLSLHYDGRLYSEEPFSVAPFD